MDEEVRRLLRRVAEDETLPPSTVSDAELLERARHEPTSALACVLSLLVAVRRRVLPGRRVSAPAATASLREASCNQTID